MSRALSTLRRRLVPYCLLGPGVLWLIVFFVVPMYFMGRLSLDSGILPTGSSFDWEFSNYRTRCRATRAVRALVLLRGHPTLIAL